MSGNKNKVCELVKSLYGLKQVPKQWHYEFDEVVLSNGYLLNQADKCVYSKFDEAGKGVIICLYVDDKLTFGTDQDQADLTKELLLSRFSVKDMGEADVILDIKIKHANNEISISQSHYIEKLEYSKVIRCLMYVITCTRPHIAFAIGILSRYPSNHINQHWQAVQRVLEGTLVIIVYHILDILQFWKDTLTQVGSAMLKTISLQVVRYSYLREVPSHGLPRRNLA
ncbi:zinc finger, CCHC-type containing protein [Tanacetum coccineum]